MFRLKKSEKSAPSEATTESGSAETTAERLERERNERHPQEKKGVPTPTRREREAARKRPLVVTDPVEAKRRRREEQAAQSEKMRTALKTGDDRYLPLQHRGENRRLIRNTIDEHFRISELLIFVAIPYVVFQLIFAQNMAAQQILAYVFMAFFAAMAIEIFMVTRLVRRRQAEKGLARQRGDVFYIIQRMGMFRKMRMPNHGV